MRRFALIAAVLVLGGCGGSSPGGSAEPRSADLTVVAVTFDPAAPASGEPVTATVQWVDLAADETFATSITIDLVLQPDDLGLVCSWETREAAGTVSCDFAGWSAPGNYRWDAWVDSLRVIEEPNEGNNTLGGSITVAG